MNMGTITEPCINTAKACGSAVYSAASYLGRPIVALSSSAMEGGKWALNGILDGIMAVWSRIEPMCSSMYGACTSPFAIAAIGVGGAAVLAYKGMQQTGSPKTAMMAGAIACGLLAVYEVVAGGMMLV